MQLPYRLIDRPVQLLAVVAELSTQLLAERPGHCDYRTGLVDPYRRPLVDEAHHVDGPGLFQV